MLLSVFRAYSTGQYFLLSNAACTRACLVCCLALRRVPTTIKSRGVVAELALYYRLIDTLLPSVRSGQRNTVL